MLRALCILIIATAGIAACDNGISPVSSYEEEVLSLRLKKDAMFFDPDRTILRPKEQAKFTGLRYFPIDSTFRFETPFERLDDPPTVLIAKQTSGPVPYSHVGFVHIPHAGQTYRLSVFQDMEMEEGTAWIPFHDATSGSETYGGGRYLDIDLPKGDTATVDFNLAYNPFCVYNAYDFNCAIPPAENRLPFAVTAGEKRALLLDE